MAEARKFRCAERKFLNLNGHHGNASVIAYVERGAKKSRRSPWVHLTISDCSREIALEFETYNEDSRRNSLFKINTLIGSLTKFRDALTLECARFDPDETAEEDY